MTNWKEVKSEIGMKLLLSPTYVMSSIQDMKLTNQLPTDLPALARSRRLYAGLWPIHRM